MSKNFQKQNAELKEENNLLKETIKRLEDTVNDHGQTIEIFFADNERLRGEMKSALELVTRLQKISESQLRTMDVVINKEQSHV
jgi:archaellum component FlaC